MKRINLFFVCLLMAASIFSCTKEDSAPESISNTSYRSTNAVNGDGFVMCFISSDEVVELKLLGNDASKSEELRNMKYSYKKPEITFNPGAKDEIKSIIKGTRFTFDNIEFEELPVVADTFMTVRRVNPFPDHPHIIPD